MALGFFSGAAAQGTADSLTEWKKIWMAEEEAERQYTLAQQQMGFQAQQASDARAFQERMERLQMAFQQGLVDRNELFEVSKIALERMPNMSLDQQWATVEELTGIGSPMAGIARNTVRTSLFTNFEDAVNLVNSVFTAPIGTPFNRAFVTLAAEQVMGRSGMDATAAETFMSDLNAALEARTGDAEKWASLQWDTATTTLAQARSNVDQTQATTRQLDAQTASIFQNTRFEAEKHGFILESLERQNNLLSLEEVRAGLVNEYLPAQLTAELNRLYAETKSVENGNELFARTIESQVERFHAETGIAKEELRHQITTSVARDAIVNGELEQLQAAIGLTTAQQGEIEARTALIGQQAAALGLDMQETRINIATQLVELGRGDLLAEVADSLFEGLNISEEGRASLLASLTETADSKLSAFERMESAQVRIALAEATYAEWNAENAPQQQAIDNWFANEQLDLSRDQLGLQEWIAREDVRLREEGLQLERDQFEAYLIDMAFRHATTGAKALGSSTEVNNDIKNALGISVGDLVGMTRGASELGADLELALDAIENGVTADIEGYAVKYGYDADVSPAMLRNDLTRRAQAAQAEAEAATLAYINAFVQRTGRIPTAQDLSFEPGHPIFQRALARVPGIGQTGATLGQEADEVLSTADHLARTVIPQIGEDGVTLGGAAAVRDQLIEQYGETRVAAAGIDSASALVPAMTAMAADFGVQQRAAQRIATEASARTGVSFDLSNVADRASLDSWVYSQIAAANAVEAALTSLPHANLETSVFGPVAPAAVAESQRVGSMLRELFGEEMLTQQGAGILDASNRILDRNAALSLLTVYQGNMANSRIALQEVDLWLGSQ